MAIDKKKLEELMNQKELRKIRMLLRAMDHPIRQDMMIMLSEKDCIVTEIWTKLKLDQGVCSQHLKILLNNGLVSKSHVGQTRSYSLNKEFLKQVSDSIKYMAEITPGN